MTNITVLIYLIDVCNMKCAYCYNVTPRTNRALDTDKILAFLEDMNIKTKRNINVSLIGGEPSIHKNIINFIDELRNREYIKQLDMYTNMTQSIEFYKYISDKGVTIAASWHNETDDREFINKVSTVKGICEVAMMFERENKDRWTEIIKILSNKIDREKIKPWILYKKSEMFDYSEDDIKQFSKTILQSKLRNFKEFPTNSNIYQTIFDSYVANYQDQTINKRCSAGYDTYYIHSDYNIYECQNANYYSKTPLYNIKDVHFKFDMNHYHNYICRCPYCRHGNFDVEIV